MCGGTNITLYKSTEKYQKLIFLHLQHTGLCEKLIILFINHRYTS